MVRKLIQFLFILTCFSSLAFIAVQTWRWPTTQTSENRALAQKPGLPANPEEAGAYPGKLEAWWNDSIHYRQHFIRISALMRMAVGINPHGQVLVGKDGWYFWTGERSDEAFRNNNPLSTEEVRRWRAYLIYRHLDAIKHGATYYFIVIPNKENVYPEYMPDNFTVLGNQSWLDQIIESVKNDGVNIIDMREALQIAKQEVQVYTKTDTHWNFHGANHAQYEIIRILAEKYSLLKPYRYPANAFYDANPTDFVNSNNTPYYTGLPFMLGINDTVNELEPLFKQPIKKCAQPAPIPLTPSWELISEPARHVLLHASRCESGHYRVLFLRDSFAQLLEYFTSEIFNYVAYVWLATPLDMESWSFLIRETKPDIVLDEAVERYLARVPKPGVDYPEPTN